MGSEKKLANVVGAKTARACDSCIRKRARWYCAADDAFLCQACDGSVHSANAMARRHKRVRLKATSLAKSEEDSLQMENISLLPTWHQGFKKKARTPRHHHRKRVSLSKSEESLRDSVQNLVPEIGNDGMTWHEENEEQLFYRVPVFDPFVAEYCCLSGTLNDPTAVICGEKERAKGVINESVGRNGNCNSLGDELLQSDVDLARFAADVESLFGKDLDEAALDMVGLGILECKDKKEGCSSDYGRVKIEEDDADVAVCNGSDMGIDDMAGEPFEFGFAYDSPSFCCKEDEKLNGAVNIVIKESGSNDEEGEAKKNVLLRLDYEGVMGAWAEQRCPWTTGDRPNELDVPDYMGGCGNVEYGGGEMRVNNANGQILSELMMDEGREARVSRYREKRRTRLFSKKIRYEVRKLNAEKRPRMKGRFVKRSN